jgi:hypothetical protein
LAVVLAVGLVVGFLVVVGFSVLGLVTDFLVGLAVVGLRLVVDGFCVVVEEGAGLVS